MTMFSQLCGEMGFGKLAKKFIGTIGKTTVSPFITKCVTGFLLCWPILLVNLFLFVCFVLYFFFFSIFSTPQTELSNSRSISSVFHIKGTVHFL